MHPRTPGTPGTAREAAATALAAAATEFPQIEPTTLDTVGLDPRDTRLALAIYRTALQRWLTLTYLLDGYLNKPMHALEPNMQGVLLSAAAQLVFMDRLPAHAVVDESVRLARAMVRPQAAGMANAVLRRLAELIDSPVRGKPWSPAADRLPLDDGFVVLRNPVLPNPARLGEYLAVATSHPEPLIERWLSLFGREQTIRIAAHGVATPPIIVAVEDGFNAAVISEDWTPHARPGFILWTGSNEALVSFLAHHPTRRVQDPASAAAVASTMKLAPKLIVDYCAGRGTKTRQLAATHPNARVIATDIDANRLTDLRASLAKHANVQVVAIDQLNKALVGVQADLLLLDVPCSNTGVLARRPEARYRFNEANLKSVAALQRRIIPRAMPLLRPGGYLLYSTCSLEPAEDQEQARWVIRESGAALVHESLMLPGEAGMDYHDGSYHALLRLPV